MAMSPVTKISLIYLVRSIARTISVFLLLFVVMMVVGDGFPAVADLTKRESLLTGAFVVMVSGLVIGWWRELVGAICILGGFAAFLLVEYVTLRDFGMNWLFALYPLDGALYLAYWLLIRMGYRSPGASR